MKIDHFHILSVYCSLVPPIDRQSHRIFMKEVNAIEMVFKQLVGNELATALM